LCHPGGLLNQVERLGLGRYKVDLEKKKREKELIKGKSGVKALARKNGGKGFEGLEGFAIVG
jgi:hypothetical protein